MSDKVTCELCGEPMPEGEGMFKYHGYSGPCPKPRKSPTPAAGAEALREENEALRRGLSFYADRDHYEGELFDDFESVSGEPENYLCGGVNDKDADLMTLIEEAVIENGEVARAFLADPIKAKKHTDEAEALAAPASSETKP